MSEQIKIDNDPLEEDAEDYSDIFYFATLADKQDDSIYTDLTG